MKKFLSTYGSLFLLATFLFPLAEKELHAWEHRFDTHCNEKSEKHIHTEEHHCSICDFSFTEFQSGIASTFSVVLTITAHDYLIPETSSPLAANLFNTPSRAPPLF
jgi:hypothetical protein